VARIRFGDLERAPKLVVLTPNSVLPRLFRIGKENLVTIHRRFAVLGPQSSRSAKRRDAALDRHPGASQRDGITRLDDCASRSLDLISGCALHSIGHISSSLGVCEFFLRKKESMWNL